MKKLSVLGIIGGAALLAAAPLSLQWSQKNVTLSLDTADARIGRPLTPVSVAGANRRAYRRAAYGGVAGAGLGSYYGYGYPAYGNAGYGDSYPAYSYPSYSYPGNSYSYPAYSYPSYGYPAGGYGGYPVARRAVIHRARWR